MEGVGEVAEVREPLGHQNSRALNSPGLPGQRSTQPKAAPLLSRGHVLIESLAGCNFITSEASGNEKGDWREKKTSSKPAALKTV